MKVDPPIRNPYLERRALNYYWAYFVPPAMIARLVGAEQSLEACLLLNALGAGLLFVASIYLYGWCLVPRAGPAAHLSHPDHPGGQRRRPLRPLPAGADRICPSSGVRKLNVDAMTSWVFQGLTIDSLPRSLWYTPQHAAACALGLIALIIPRPPQAPAASDRDGLVAGIPLGLAIIFSPFLGGIFCVVYGLTAVWVAWTRSRTAAAGGRRVRHGGWCRPLAGLGWCVAQSHVRGRRRGRGLRAVATRRAPRRSRRMALGRRAGPRAGARRR